MSAWIVSEKHIDYMVTAVIRAELVADNPDEIGRMLWRECLASVAYRYPNDGDGERPGPVDFKDSDVDTYTWTETDELDAPELATTLRCYDYQSCEHPGYKTSEAKAIVDKLLAGMGKVDWEGSTAPWGW